MNLSPVKGIYIYSSLGAFKTEQEFDFIRLNKWLEEYRIKPYVFKIEEIDGEKKPAFTRGFHASGHASKSELEWIIKKINPDIIIKIPEWLFSR